MEGKGTSLRKLIANKRWKGKPFQLLEAIHLLKEVTMIHCWGHQNVLTLVSPWNNQADWEAKQPSRSMASRCGLSATFALFPPQEPKDPRHSSDKEKEAVLIRGQEDGAWWHGW
jgi:hypothetical protein